jgi:GlcNAc-P-P-Und epimerase
MRRILITGGSGFIGTNLVRHLAASGCEVLSLDVAAPRDGSNLRFHESCDILDAPRLRHAFEQFNPTELLHLAARTDLKPGANIDYYLANTQGVRNVLEAARSQPSLGRSVFFSSKLVCANDSVVSSVDEYCPDTVYGESKAHGERLVRSAELHCPWTIVRPTSIWGPWFRAPYLHFFKMIQRRLYMHMAGMDPMRSFGYVGNVAFQIDKILGAEVIDVSGRIFYLSDYEPYTIREWADMISREMHGKGAHTIPAWPVRLMARCGDVLQALGWRNPPVSSFRLRNMMADTTRIPLSPTRDLTGPLPYSMEAGVVETVAWLRSEARDA